jgi:DNA processing protein
MHSNEFITPDDGRYPILLKVIKKPPEMLYFQGDLSLLSKRTVAIVGARKPTEYGKWAAFTIAKKLSSNGIVIVSGMAEGIDSMAHRGALEGGTPTVAVMGTGIDICFPTFNENLREEILQNGLILSESQPGTPGSRYSFPLRNRVISGVSAITIVAEAALTSGSLITAERAAEQGRAVYAVPGNINRTMSVGCNKLIKDGATPIYFINDLLADIGIRDDNDESLIVDLSDSEKTILNTIKNHGELSINDISQLNCWPPTKVIPIVSILEIKGLIGFSSGRAFTIGNQ